MNCRSNRVTPSHLHPKVVRPCLANISSVPDRTHTLELIARSKGEAFYRGELAKAIADHARATGGLMDEQDLAAHQCDWVDPISVNYRDLTAARNRTEWSRHRCADGPGHA